MNQQNLILYEQPTNELTRLCLRLEQLFQYIDRYIDGSSPFDSRTALMALLEIVNIIVERGDLKASMIKELTRHQSSLIRLEEIPEIDHTQRQRVLNEVSERIKELNNITGKFAQNLYHNEFLNSLRLQLSNPGGPYTANTAALTYWLHHSFAHRRAQLDKWRQELGIIQNVVELILNLVRDSSISEFKTAHNGFFEVSLDPKHPCQLARIELPEDVWLYPEVSAGRNRLCVRFIETQFSHRAQQANKDVLFKLTCCLM